MFVFLFYKSTTVVIVSLPFTVLNEELQIQCNKYSICGL